MSVITFNTIIDDLEATLEFFDRIEIYRSVTTIGGIYEEVTSSEGPLAAVVDGSIAGTWNLDGLTLQVNIDGVTTPEEITFVGDDPLDLATVIAQINAVVGIASEVPTDTNCLRLTSPTDGTGSLVEVVAGAAATALGLSITKSHGYARRMRIVDPTTIYSFSDLDGANTYWYKTRFSSTEGSEVSDYTDPRLGGSSLVIASSNLITATADLMTGSGEPVIGAKLIFRLVSNINVSDFWALPGFHSRVEIETNGNGHAQIDLIKGATYRVSFEGTSFTREFVAPSSGTTFNLMTVIGTTPDPYDIAQTPPRPIKMST